MKKLLLVAALLCSALSFSQVDIKIDKKIEGDAYARIFPDGTSVIHIMSEDHTYQYSYDLDGDLLYQKEQDFRIIPGAYLDQEKIWIRAHLGYRSADIFVGDFEGNVTKTTLKNKKINVQSPRYNVTPDGKLEVLITDNMPSNMKFKKGFIDYIVLQYDPEKKVFNFIDYTDIPNIEGSTSFIGQKGNEKLFVNWFKTSKNLYTLQVLAIDEKKNVRTFAPTEFEFANKEGIFVGGSAIGLKFPVEDYDDIYYAIHCVTKRKEGLITNPNLAYKVYRVKKSGESSSVSLTVPIGSGSTSIVHLPLYMLPKDSKGENTFYLRDATGNGVEFATDFSTSKIDPKAVTLPKALEVYYFRDIFPVMYEEFGKTDGEYFFRLCEDNNARLLIKTEDNQFTLYEEKMP